jgi:hypothetical protein
MRAVSRPSRAAPRGTGKGEQRPSVVCWLPCTRCRRILPSQQFYWDSHGARWRTVCKACTLDARKRGRAVTD